MGKLALMWRRLVALGKGLAGMIRLLAAMATLLVAFGFGYALVAWAQALKPHLVSLGVFLGSIGLAFLLGVVLVTALGDGEGAKLSPRYHWRILEREVVYRCEGGGRMSQVKKFRVRALEDNLAYFEDRYKWSGTGRVVLSLRTPGKLVEVPPQEARLPGWDVYRVFFPQPLRRGEEARIEVVWDLTDDRGTALPFLSTTVDMPTDRLEMKVLLDRPLSHTMGTVLLAGSASADVPLTVGRLTVDADGKSITWSPANPQIGYRYLITWEC